VVEVVVVAAVVVVVVVVVVEVVVVEVVVVEVVVEGSRDLPILLIVMMLLMVPVLMDDDSFLELTNPRLKVHDSLTLLDIESIIDITLSIDSSSRIIPVALILTTISISDDNDDHT
jgi:hypothetical protein